MLGWFPFAFDIVSIFFWPGLAIRSFFVWRRRPDNLRAITGFIASTGISIFVTFLLGSTLLRQSSNYFLLRTINSNDVVSIKFGNVNWTNKADIKRITDALNGAVWHKVSHDGIGLFSNSLTEMTVSFHSGSVMNFYVERYNNKDAALVDRIIVNNGTQLVTSGDSYIPGLPTTLEGLNYALPPVTPGYTPGILDYLFLWFFVGVFTIVFWPKGLLKKWRRAA